MLNAKQSDTSCYNCINGRVDDNRPSSRYDVSLNCRCTKMRRAMSETTFMMYIHMCRYRCRYFRRHYVERKTV